MKKSNNQSRILIVEDDEICRRVVVRKLKSAHILTDESRDGEEALRKMKSAVYRLILLDIRLPIKDGYQVLKEMKESPKLKNIPVWILTNVGFEEEMNRAISLGAARCFLKTNLAIDQLVKSVADFLAKLK